MNKRTLFSLVSFFGILLFVGNAQLEARPCYPRARVQVGVQPVIERRHAPVLRKVIRQIPAQPIIVQHMPSYRPVYVYPAEMHAQPVYVEEVYVAPPRRSFGFGGLSFSFNLFR